MEDLEGPELVKVDINKSSINASEEITVFIDPKEDISGVQYAGIVVKSPSGNQSFGKNIWSPDAEGRYTYTISIGENAEAGKWGVDSISLVDNAGNTSVYWNGRDYDLNFDVVNTNEDTTGPALAKVEINKSTISAGEEITVFIDPRNDISGVQYAGIVVKSPSGNQSFGKNIWSPDAEGRYTYTISIGENAEAGKWGVDSISLVDNAGNTSVYWNGRDYVLNFDVNNQGDYKKPNVPTVQEITDRESNLVGTSDPGSTVVITVDGKEIARTFANEKGNFSVSIDHHTAGKLIKVYAVDSSGSTSEAASITVKRKLQTLIGSTRYTTAIEASRMGWKTSGTVLLSNGEAIVDGLTATPLASAKNSPLLLTKRTLLPDETLQEIRRLGAKEIILIGGTGVISTTVENQLKSKGYKVTRIGGKDRYETSLMIARELDKIIDVDTVHLAYGWGEPDALSIAAQAGLKKQPIILANKNTVPAATFSWLKQEGLANAYFIGGTGVISPNILSQMDSITKQSVLKNRISGQDRNATNAKVLERFYKGANLQTILVAKSETNLLVDALTAGPLAAKMGVPVLLVSQKGLHPEQQTVLNGITTKFVHQIGGGIKDSVINVVVQ
ncbi:cell wall-binding repeat-containing protein [Mesobacillus subterraneus]|nr:cell wall-binding repeat-containing protein [Mesobacillus subterraneus]